jgi:hypothetical protein
MHGGPLVAVGMQCMRAALHTHFAFCQDKFALMLPKLWHSTIALRTRAAQQGHARGDVELQILQQPFTMARNVLRPPVPTFKQLINSIFLLIILLIVLDLRVDTPRYAAPRACSYGFLLSVGSSTLACSDVRIYLSVLRLDMYRR